MEPGRQDNRKPTHYSRAELSLLIVLEEACVRNQGCFDMARLATEDWETLGRWQAQRFLRVERLLGRHTVVGGPDARTHMVRLSEGAWLVAGRARQAEAKRTRFKF